MFEPAQVRGSNATPNAGTRIHGLMVAVTATLKSGPTQYKNYSVQSVSFQIEPIFFLDSFINNILAGITEISFFGYYYFWTIISTTVARKSYPEDYFFGNNESQKSNLAEPCFRGFFSRLI